MSTQVVVVGSGYAGAGAVKAFEDEVGEGEADLTWISEHDYHLVLHEVHRAIHVAGRTLIASFRDLARGAPDQRIRPRPLDAHVHQLAPQVPVIFQKHQLALPRPAAPAPLATVLDQYLYHLALQGLVFLLQDRSL